MVGSKSAVESLQSSWLLAHEALSRLAKQRAAADAEEGRWLLAAWRAGAHVHLGYGSFAEYIERLFGYKPRSSQEKLRVAEALEGLPALAHALESGELSWCAVRELSRVALAENEREWLEVARGKTVRQLEELVAGKRPGDGPASPGDPSLRRHVLRFEVTPETLAMFRDALTFVRRSAGAALDDDAALLSLARQVLAGPQDEGRASYQIALTVCAHCGAGAQLAGGELLSVGPEVVAMAACDGQHLGHLQPAAANDTSVEGQPRPALPHPVQRVNAHVSARAKQTTPPALRRKVLLRDHRRCRVPGCKNTAYLDLHHLHLRSDGGPSDPDNLITLCGAHHRAAHRGKLLVDGSATTGLRFRHADGSDYGHAVSPRNLDAQSKVFSALRNLGFRESQVRSVLTELRHQTDLREASTEQLLRTALQRLTERRRRG